MMESENSKKQTYEEYKKLLERIRTYTHLIFYNRKLINPNQLASYGFKLSQSKDGNEQAKCCECGKNFLLDPLIESQTMELKDNYNHVIHSHEEGCKFRESSNKKIIQINYETETKFGIMNFLERYEQNEKNMMTVSMFYSQQKQIPQQIEKKYVNMLQSLRENGKIVIFTLLGWKVINNTESTDLVQCQYCGAIKTIKDFDVIDSHRSTCAMKRLKCWQPIISQLALDQLEDKQGQFLKTQSEVMEKKLKDEVATTFGQLITSFRVRMANVSEQMVNLVQDNDEYSKAYKNYYKERKIVFDELQDIIKSGIKKVKIS